MPTTTALPAFRDFPRPQNLPCDKTTEGHILQAFLAPMFNKADPSSPYIHSQPVSFYTAQDKANWRTWMPTEDHKARDTFKSFTHASHHGRNTWLAFFSTPTGSWVGKSATEQEHIAWHCFAAAVIAGQAGGKHIIIWDCDPRRIFDDKRALPLRPNEFMISHQHGFLNELQKRWNIKSLWYNQDLSFSGQDKCLQHALHWVYWCSKFGDLKFQGPTDPRLAGCEEVVILK